MVYLFWNVTISPVGLQVIFNALQHLCRFQGCECGDQDVGGSRRSWMALVVVATAPKSEKEEEEKKCGAIILNRKG